MVTTTTPTIPKTLLQAVNELLKAIRVAPAVSLLETDMNEDAAAARQALDTASIEVQQRGWEFNTERDATLDLDLSGNCYLPSNTLKVVSAYCASGDRLVQRGQRLYNTKKRTFNLTGQTVKVDIVLALVFEDLTSTARSYVTGVAARAFCLPKLPTGATSSYTTEWLNTTLAAMEQEDTEQAGSELKGTSPHFARMGRR